MAVPNDNFGLIAVITEIDKYGEIVLKDSGTGGSLVNAFAASDNTGFVGSGRDSLLDFAGYEHPNPAPPPPPPTVYAYNLGFHPSNSATACDNFAFNTFTTVYSYSDNFYAIDTVLYATNPPNESQKAPAGYYTSDFGWRYWSGSAFTSSGSCDGGGGLGPAPGGGFD